ncbi:MAG: Holliday junction branch migration protein RuvA [Bacteroidales bacterium]|nr:Holliday junction branch migration protein RuvA [Bacteroidales bacterium]HOY39495.1 Holliday junction branch migration protein RuvA [Bacteroidales bacterium]HQP04069.1 Holliday junction branch migration protein RuvA [Bacteroidales bacterium]
MYEYIKGKLTELNAAYAVVESGGIGYSIQISLNTFSKLTLNDNALLYLHFIVREDVQQLFGFADKTERNVFKHLIAVNGIGPNTARMILSSLGPEELMQAIATKNISVLKSIKGIGQKSAERMVIELKDKLVTSDADFSHNFNNVSNSLYDDALQALLMLGFNRASIDKVLREIMKSSTESSVEQIVKRALKEL